MKEKLINGMIKSNEEMVHYGAVLPLLRLDELGREGQKGVSRALHSATRAREAAFLSFRVQLEASVLMG